MSSENYLETCISTGVLTRKYIGKNKHEGSTLTVKSQIFRREIREHKPSRVGFNLQFFDFIVSGAVFDTFSDWKSGLFWTLNMFVPRGRSDSISSMESFYFFITGTNFEYCADGGENNYNNRTLSSQFYKNPNLGNILVNMPPPPIVSTV